MEQVVVHPRKELTVPMSIPLSFRALALAIGLWVTPWAGLAGVQVLYETGFEYSEGFDAAYELPGQAGWVGFPYDTNSFAVNSSGIISNTVAAPSQEAYVGFFTPNPLRNFVSVWKPVNYVPTTEPLVSFEVLMTITSSSASHPNLDNFRWSVYNIEGNRLFSVDFDNYYLDVSYQLDGEFTNVVTGQRFTNDTPFRFSLTMDFQSNRWSAAIDGGTFLTGLPITTTNAPLNLGDVDAVWAIYEPSGPGDNYMVFDDYRITAAPVGIDSARLERLGFAGPAFVLRLHGPDECRYAIEVTTDLVTWMPLKTNVVTGGYFDYVDTNPNSDSLRLYRARFVP